MEMIKIFEIDGEEISFNPYQSFRKKEIKLGEEILNQKRSLRSIMEELQCHKKRFDAIPKKDQIQRGALTYVLFKYMEKSSLKEHSSNMFGDDENFQDFTMTPHHGVLLEINQAIPSRFKRSFVRQQINTAVLGDLNKLKVYCFLEGYYHEQKALEILLEKERILEQKKLQKSA